MGDRFDFLEDIDTRRGHWRFHVVGGSRHLSPGQCSRDMTILSRSVRCKTSVQSHFQFSKLHIDPTLSDVKEFRSRLIGDTPSSSVRIAQVSSQGGSSGIAELRRGTAVVKTIEQVIALEEGQVWITGRIMGINSGQNDWSYQACTSCDKKVEEKNNGKYKCKNCKTDEAEAELR
ncbi:hypothetical protein PIB30_095706 [Stylosanthes scabra]|uniref:Replication factor A C-terminal domain-containing protein n=1 Tax=Stylosanthes scabra TaxID=79078 RepID=A0ABU6YTE6_9FABA|nr:hypothetical protein [Stylosanthes scabra]